MKQREKSALASDLRDGAGSEACNRPPSIFPPRRKTLDFEIGFEIGFKIAMVL